jgi:hypothetical protein
MSTAWLVVIFVLLFYFLLDQASCDKTPTDSCLPTPYVFNPNQQITADFTDLGGAVGVCSVTNRSAAVTWISGGLFNTGVSSGPPYPGLPIWGGQQINIAGVLYQISGAAGSGVTSQTTLTLATTYQGATSATAAFAVSNTASSAGPKVPK